MSELLDFKNLLIGLTRLNVLKFNFRKTKASNKNKTNDYKVKERNIIFEYKILDEYDKRTESELVGGSIEELEPNVGRRL